MAGGARGARDARLQARPGRPRPPPDARRARRGLARGGLRYSQALELDIRPDGAVEVDANARWLLSADARRRLAARPVRAAGVRRPRARLRAQGRAGGQGPERRGRSPTRHTSSPSPTWSRAPSTRTARSTRRCGSWSSASRGRAPSTACRSRCCCWQRPGCRTPTRARSGGDSRSSTRTIAAPSTSPRSIASWLPSVACRRRRCCRTGATAGSSRPSSRALHARRADPDLFARGAVHPLDAGPEVLAFARELGGRWLSAPCRARRCAARRRPASWASRMVRTGPVARRVRGQPARPPHGVRIASGDAPRRRCVREDVDARPRACGCCAALCSTSAGRAPRAPAARSCRSARAGPSSGRTSRRPGCPSTRPHASTVPSAAGFCSSALPSGTQSPRSREHRVQVVEAAQVVASWVLPTCTTSAGGSSVSSRYASNSELPARRLQLPGALAVPCALLMSTMVTAGYLSVEASCSSASPTAAMTLEAPARSCHSAWLVGVGPVVEVRRVPPGARRR